MQQSDESNKSFFDKYGLEVAEGQVEVGSTYPIFGMITGIINDTPGEVVAQINYNITAKMNIPEQEKVELLKERAFETGIFVSKITKKEPQVEVDCQTVIFGKKQGFNA